MAQNKGKAKSNPDDAKRSTYYHSQLRQWVESNFPEVSDQAKKLAEEKYPRKETSSRSKIALSGKLAGMSPADLLKARK